MRCVLSVLGKDITGIVARVATSLANDGVNIVDIRQSLLEDIFSMTMLVDVNEERASFNQVQEHLHEVAQGLGVQIKLQREDLFKTMYEI